MYKYVHNKYQIKYGESAKYSETRKFFKDNALYIALWCMSWYMPNN